MTPEDGGHTAKINGWDSTFAEGTVGLSVNGIRGVFFDNLEVKPI